MTNLIINLIQLCCSFSCSSTTHQSSGSHHCLWWICVWKTSQISHPHCWPLGQTSSNYQGTAKMIFFFLLLHTKPNYSQKMQRSKHCLHCSFFYLISNFSAKARLRYRIYSKMISISNCFFYIEAFCEYLLFICSVQW